MIVYTEERRLATLTRHPTQSDSGTVFCLPSRQNFSEDDGMTSDDIRIIEQRLCVTLPPAYRQALLNGITIGGADPDIHFLQDPKELLIVNLELRAARRQNAFAGARWPNAFVCIGVDGCGNYYAVDAGQTEGGVLFFDHEADRFETKAKSLRDYFSHLADLFRWVGARKQASTPMETAMAESRISKDAVIAPLRSRVKASSIRSRLRNGRHVCLVIRG